MLCRSRIHKPPSFFIAQIPRTKQNPGLFGCVCWSLRRKIEQLSFFPGGCCRNYRRLSLNLQSSGPFYFSSKSQKFSRRILYCWEGTLSCDIALLESHRCDKTRDETFTNSQLCHIHGVVTKAYPKQISRNIPCLRPLAAINMKKGTNISWDFLSQTQKV